MAKQQINNNIRYIKLMQIHYSMNLQDLAHYLAWSLLLIAGNFNDVF